MKPTEGKSSKQKPGQAILIRMFPTSSSAVERDRAQSCDPQPRSADDPINIVIVDAQRFMLEVVSTMLRRHNERYKVVAEAEDLDTALSACEQFQPDLLILDINLPKQAGMDVVRTFKAVCPKMRVLLCTDCVTEDRSLEVLRAGAHGFVEKTGTWNHFIDAVKRVARGEHYFSFSGGSSAPDVANVNYETLASGLGPLSIREKEVLKLVAHGESSKEIAQKLGISVGTIAVHRANLMKKLRVRNIASLVVLAFHAGLIQ